MSAVREMQPVYGQASVGNGVSLHYQHYQGDSSSPCMVLLHSLAMDHTFWRLVAPTMARSGPVICVDLLGHGKSSKPAGPYSIAMFAQGIARLVEALGYDKVVIAGASLGGCIALQFAIDNPQRTSGLGLFGTTAWYGETAPADWAARAAKAQEQGLASLIEFQKTRWFGDEFRAGQVAVVQDCVDVFLRNDIRAYVATCHAMGAFDARSGAAQLRLPTAILAGEEDYAAPPAMAKALHEAISGSSLAIIPAARHLIPLEKPESVIPVLQDLVFRAKR